MEFSLITINKLEINGKEISPKLKGKFNGAVGSIFNSIFPAYFKTRELKNMEIGQKLEVETCIKEIIEYGRMTRKSLENKKIEILENCSDAEELQTELLKIDTLIEQQQKKLNREVIGLKARRFLAKKTEAEIYDQMPEEGVIKHFFRYAENISDEDMQNLWARILAGEIAQPDSTSIMTMDVLSKLSKSDLQDLEKLFSCFIQHDLPNNFSGLRLTEDLMQWIQLSTDILLKFEVLGIVTQGHFRNRLYSMSSFAVSCVSTMTVQNRLHKIIEVELKEDIRLTCVEMHFGTNGTIYVFVSDAFKPIYWVGSCVTPVGKQLSNYTSIEPHPDLIKHSLKKMAENGYDQYFVINKKMLAGMSKDEIAAFYRDQIIEHDINFNRYLTEDKTSDKPEKNT